MKPKTLKPCDLAKMVTNADVGVLLLIKGGKFGVVSLGKNKKHNERAMVIAADISDAIRTKHIVIEE